MSDNRSPARLLRLLGPMLACWALAGCVAPAELPTEGLRPGISAEAFKTARTRPGLNLRYTYDLPAEGPLQMTASFVTLPGSAGTVRYEGEMRISVPGGDAERVADILLPKDIDLPFYVKGDSIIFEGAGRLDRKGRQVSVRSRLESAEFIPHDCSATLGLCQSMARSDTGEELHVIVETTYSNGFWRSYTRLDPTFEGSNKLLSQSVYSLDRNLMLIDMRSTDYPTRGTPAMVVRRQP